VSDERSRRGAAVVVDRVSKSFEGGRIQALRELSLEVAPGEYVALTGPSGCGKSTLLNLVGALDRPDSGSVAVGGIRLEEVADVSEYRAATVGFVFQFHNLIPTLTALENVQVPMIGRRPRADRVTRARELLGEVGLVERLGSYPGTLSGGERQRVAIARALANEPRLLLADEPTGALDTDTGATTLALLQRLRGQYGMTILLVTNDPLVADTADRIVALRDGRMAPAAAATR
jgi:putative ABC transport system ATP-binding protein